MRRRNRIEKRKKKYQIQQEKSVDETDGNDDTYEEIMLDDEEIMLDDDDDNIDESDMILDLDDETLTNDIETDVSTFVHVFWMIFDVE